MQQLATKGDAEAAFPEAELDALAASRDPRHPLAERGALLGRARADLLAQTLAQLGRGNLSVGRLVEAHINARHLIARFGTRAQRAQAMADVQAGELFALWVTDPPDDGLRMMRRGDRLLLEGGKMFCSGAGFATRALLTARDEVGQLPDAGGDAQCRRASAPARGAIARNARRSDGGRRLQRMQHCNRLRAGNTRRLSEGAGFLSRRLARFGCRIGRTAQPGRPCGRDFARSGTR